MIQLLQVSAMLLNETDTIMIKLLKTILVVGYIYLFIQYIMISLDLKKDIMELDYITPSSRKITKSRRRFVTENLTKTKSVFNPVKRFPTDYKYILKYSNVVSFNTNKYNSGQNSFIENNCEYINCFLTSNKNLLLDIRYFDAILFSVEDGWGDDIPSRHSSQKYVFMALDSSAAFPLCESFYNNFYNITWTYKLNSDIIWPYFNILDKTGNVVGPRQDMTWVKSKITIPAKIIDNLNHKTKAVAWFVSNCKDNSGRKQIAKELKEELQKYNLTIDTYGWCGKKKCPKNDFNNCLALLQAKYYFYLSFENYFIEDFVTERLLYALQNFAVPIVYGGADYARFLPPGSYLDATILKASEIAEKMYTAIKNQTIYKSYFRWHNNYVYQPRKETPDMCKLCKMLNEETHQHNTYTEFVTWWNDRNGSSCTKLSSIVADSHENTFMTL